MRIGVKTKKIEKMGTLENKIDSHIINKKERYFTEK